MKSIELFAGIGGISLAAEWAGIETMAFCEREPFCQKVLSKHWPDVPIFDDVKTLNKQLLEERGIGVGTIDIISGGFPCQPYSIAGKRKGTEDDRDLWPEMFRIIEEIKPSWVVGENVANFVNMELDRTLSDLESIGYETQSFVIPACAVDAKHERKRTFIVAYSNNRRCNNGVSNREERQIQNNKKWNAKESESKRERWVSRIREIDKVLLCNSDSKPKLQTNQTFNQIGERWNTRKSIARFNWGESSRSYWEKNKSPVCGMDDGLSSKLDESRLIALGNAVVPQQIYPIFKAIVEIEKLQEVKQ
ncbi:DNA cytosine methyltransferase [Virgibacillus sp. Bac332]|uniref:DNA cytosine methyltransferase n=1 Tax=Virgibacillus sp. Bac332 TaxID=2419842 RepID=UPI000EF4A8D7|nr:DNA (cytosine-5-)-methyltransferase [Virgibacillus sp. Bac332]